MHSEQASKDLVNLEADSAMMIDMLHEQDQLLNGLRMFTRPKG